MLTSVGSLLLALALSHSISALPALAPSNPPNLPQASNSAILNPPATALGATQTAPTTLALAPTSIQTIQNIATLNAAQIAVADSSVLAEEASIRATMSSVTCVAGQPNCDTLVKRSAAPAPQESVPATVAVDQPTATAAGPVETTVGIAASQPTAVTVPQETVLATTAADPSIATAAVPVETTVGIATAAVPLQTTIAIAASQPQETVLATVAVDQPATTMAALV